MGEMNFTHIHQIPFTGLGLHNGFRGNRWLKNRIEIFKEFVLPSLKLQNADCWFQWRAEEENNPIVKEFQKDLNGLRAIHTFGGITFWDDKYPDKEASRRLMESLEVSLTKFNSSILENYVILTIQPSDDIYFQDAPEKIQAKFTELINKDGIIRRAVGWKKGYIMCYNNKELAEYTTDSWKNDGVSTYHTDTTPPFFSILFPKDVFLNPKKHYDWIGPYRSHEQIVDVMDYTALEGRGFIVGTHSENISTTFNHRYAGRRIIGEEKNILMERAGILNSKPVKFKPSFRLRIRKVVNSLPFRQTLKGLYYKLPAKLRVI